MRKANLTILVLVMASFLALASMVVPAKCVGLTTGFTFVLNEPYPLEHVYVLTGGPGGGGSYEDILLEPPFTTGPYDPPGFTVPVGTSDFVLEPTFGTSGSHSHFAVIGTYTWAPTGETHLVLGTGADLTGVPLGDILRTDIGYTYEILIATLQNGEPFIQLWDLVEGLHYPPPPRMAPMGSTIQLYFFSDVGQPFDASVIANEYGNPDPPIIMNNPPVADPDGPYSGIIGVPLTFDGSGSYDTDGTIVSYDWDFGDSGTGAGVTPTHTYASAGVYTVTLTVTDDAGATDTATSTATIPSQQVIPEVPFGTIIASAAMIIALVAYVALPKFWKRPISINP